MEKFLICHIARAEEDLQHLLKNFTKRSNLSNLFRLCAIRAPFQALHWQVKKFALPLQPRPTRFKNNSQTFVVITSLSWFYQKIDL